MNVLESQKFVYRIFGISIFFVFIKETIFLIIISTQKTIHMALSIDRGVITKEVQYTKKVIKSSKELM